MTGKNIIFVLLSIVIVVIVLVIIKANNNYVWGRVSKIKDVSKAELITLHNDNNHGLVWGIKIIIEGYIDGDSTVKQSYTDKGKITVHKFSRIGKGKVSLSIGGDWYMDECFIDYAPLNVRSGNLQIRYEFMTLPNLHEQVEQRS